VAALTQSILLVEMLKSFEKRKFQRKKIVKKKIYNLLKFLGVFIFNIEFSK
jgi:hypothetical protein